MKRRMAVILCLFLLTAALVGCRGKNTAQDNAKQGKNAETKYKTVTSEVQNFSTQCLETYQTRWDDEDGLYIYTETMGSIPYVLMWRFQEIAISAEQFLEENVRAWMEESYGSDLIASSPVETHFVGDKNIPGILFTYKLDGYTIQSLRLAYKVDNDIINFTAKYIEGDEKATMEALDVAVKSFSDEIETNPGSTTPASGQENGKFVITPSESASVKYTKYTDPSGYFSMDIPVGWNVKIGLPPEYGVDLISYAITVNDSKNTDRKLYFNLNCVGGLKSEEARKWYNTWYPDTFGLLPAISDISTKGFFSVMGQYFGYTDFSVQENIGRTILNGDLLYAKAKSATTGKTILGEFTAMVDAMSNPVQKNPFNYAEGFVDVGYVSAYTIIYETAPENEFLDWKPVLDHCFESIQFTDAFQSQRQQQWKSVMGTSSYIFSSANEINDMIMDTWEKRNTSYDIISQKQSDATLGYERVYDNETGLYYKAEIDLCDELNEKRYVVTTEDAAYLTPFAGWIERK